MALKHRGQSVRDGRLRHEVHHRSPQGVTRDVLDAVNKRLPLGLWRKLHRRFVEDTPERSDEDVVGDDVGLEAVEVAHVVQPVVPRPVVVGPELGPLSSATPLGATTRRRHTVDGHV